MENEKKKWYEKKGLLYFLLIFIWPVGLFGLIKNKNIKKSKKIILFLIFLVWGIFTIANLSNSEGTTTYTEGPNPSDPVIEYQILEEEKLGKIKYALDIEVPNEIEEYEIETIFSSIKNKNTGYERYFIHFFLPGMTVGSGAWATANYDGSLNITVMGLSASDAKNLSSRSFNESLGVWKDNFMGAIIHLININGEYFIRSEFDDGSHLDKLVIKESGELIFSVPDSTSGDYYIIVGDSLEAWDSEGKIDRYEIVKTPEFDLIVD